MNTRDIILLAEYLLHRERDTSPFTSYAEAVKVATLLEQTDQPLTSRALYELQAEGVSPDAIADLAGLHDPRSTTEQPRTEESAARALLTRTFGLDPTTVDVTRSACQIHDLIEAYTQALALAVPDTAADSLPGGRARLVHARGGTFLFAEEGDVQWDEPSDQAPESDLRKHIANALAVLDVIAPRPWGYRPFGPDGVPLVVDLNDRCTCGDANEWPSSSIDRLNALPVHTNGLPAQSDVDLVLRAIDTVTDCPRPWKHDEMAGWLAKMDAGLARHGWTAADLVAVANSLPRSEPSPNTNAKPDVGALIERDGRVMRFTGDAWETLVPITRCELAELKAEQHAEAAQGFARTAELLLPGQPCTVDSIIATLRQLQQSNVLMRDSLDDALERVAKHARTLGDLRNAGWELLASLTEVDDATPDAELPDLLVSEAKRQRKLGSQAIADAGLPVTLSASDAIDRLAAERDSLRRTLESVQRERDGLAQAYAVAKAGGPKQMPLRIYDALTYVRPQDYANRIAKVGDALAAHGLTLDYEHSVRNVGRFDLLLTEHNSRVQLRANGEAVVTGEAAHLVELGGLKADIEHVLRADGWKVSG
jgi:hypothetical protein